MIMSHGVERLRISADGGLRILNSNHSIDAKGTITSTFHVAIGTADLEEAEVPKISELPKATVKDVTEATDYLVIANDTDGQTKGMFRLSTARDVLLGMGISCKTCIHGKTVAGYEVCLDMKKAVSEDADSFFCANHPAFCKDSHGVAKL